MRRLARGLRGGGVRFHLPHGARAAVPTLWLSAGTRPPWGRRGRNDPSTNGMTRAKAGVARVLLAGAVAITATSVATGEEAQTRPFLFTVTTGNPAAEDRWVVSYEAGYAQQTTDTFGGDQLAQG